MRPIARFGLVLSVFAGLAPLPASARVYLNPEFGMRVLVPDAFTLCLDTPAEMNNFALGPFRPRDHGPDIMLDAKSKHDCRADDGRRWVSIYAGYNVIPEESTLEGLRKSACDLNEENAAGECTAGPSGLGLKGIKTLTVQRRLKNGWIDIAVVAEMGTTPHDQEPEGVSYKFRLHTNVAHRDEDLAAFRKILRGARLWRTTTPVEGRDPA